MKKDAGEVYFDGKSINRNSSMNGLDPQGVLYMREFIKEQAKKGVTFIYCSHILSEVQNLCNRIALIKEGVIIAEDSTSKLLSQERSVYIYYYYHIANWDVWINV